MLPRRSPAVKRITEGAEWIAANLPAYARFFGIVGLYCAGPWGAMR
jgi:hypothetical protein